MTFTYLLIQKIPKFPATDTSILYASHSRADLEELVLSICEEYIYYIYCYNSFSLEDMKEYEDKLKSYARSFSILRVPFFV